MGLDARQPQ